MPDADSITYRTLPHLPGYRIGSDGSVWSERRGRWKRLKGGQLPTGHRYVNLVLDGRSRPFAIHRLVLEAFIGPCPPGMECCHYPDRNPNNNRLENLRWGTRRENIQDAIRHDTLPRGSQKWTAKLNEADVIAIRWLRVQGWTCKRIADVFYVSFEAIRRIVKGTAWRHVPR